MVVVVGYASRTEALPLGIDNFQVVLTINGISRGLVVWFKCWTMARITK